MSIKKYFFNCFLLLVPILLWNVLLIDNLPKGYSSNIFWKDIPNLVGYSENILRVVVFALPSVMILSIRTRGQKTGLWFFLLGSAVYFLSWMAVISYPESEWSQSTMGFMAPAYTPIIWLIGIGLIGNHSFLRIPNMTTLYIGISLLFVAVHTLHAHIVFLRL